MTAPHLPVTPGRLASTWSLEPAVVGGLAFAAGLYLLGTRRLRARGATRDVAFAAALVAIAAALLSPLAALAEAIFAAHMVQHLLLILVAAPLLVATRAEVALFAALPRSVRMSVQRARRLFRLDAFTEWLTKPISVWLLHTGVLWVWHLPLAYEAGLTNEALHALEHASFLATAVLFWRFTIPMRGRRRYGYGATILLAFATYLQSGFLGALLTLSPNALYPVHAAGAALWGLTPLEDQQLAGSIMWVPPGIAYLAVMAALSWLAFRDLDARFPPRHPGKAMSAGERP